MKRYFSLRCSACTLLLLLALFPWVAQAEEAGNDMLYSVKTADGAAVFNFFGAMHDGDEYIAADNTLYRIVSVSSGQAVAEKVGLEDMPDVSWLSTGEATQVFSALPVASAANNSAKNDKLVAMYVTHSDESYVPTDGTESINGQGGIYDVARSFRDELQALGIDVILDESTHLPHDSGAYRRSRQTAERLLQKQPDAIIDIHRDGIPDKTEYTCTIDGENASQVRLLVGKSNQNSEVNRAFAKEIKAVADKKYPGLIKDIFIGKGNYNQDLAPRAILLEFGTHTLDKERVLESTQLMANVMNTTLYGQQTGSAKAHEAAEENPKTKASQGEKKGSAVGIFLVILVLIGGVILFSFMQTGSVKGMRDKIGRNAREITGGLLGKKKKDN